MAATSARRTRRSRRSSRRATTSIRASAWRWSRASTEPPRPRALLVAGLALLAAFAALAALVAAGWPPLLRLDRSLGAALARVGAEAPVLRAGAELLDAVGAGGPSTIAVAVAAALLWRAHRRLAVWLVASAAGTWLCRLAVREAIDRARPIWPDAAPLPSTPAFPSGHTTTGIAVWAVLGVIILLLAGDLGRSARWAGVGLIVGGVLMGPSRLLLGVHWPSDVVGGWLLAGGVACLAGALVLRGPGRATRGG